LVASATYTLSSAQGGVAWSQSASGTTLTLSIERGPGTQLKVTVTNAGPMPTGDFTNPYGPPTNGFSLTLDKGSSGSTYMVAASVVTSGHWKCAAAYDVVNCHEPGSFGVGQSMTMTFPMNLCYPSSHAYELSYYTNASGAQVGYDLRSDFSGPSGGCTSTHIGFLKVSASAELQRLAAQFRQQVEVLAKEKQAVEDALSAKAAGQAAAQAAAASAANEVEALVAKIAQTSAFAQKINVADKSLPLSVQAELQAESALDSSIASLQDQIVAARRAGNGSLVSSLTERLDREESQLATITRELTKDDAPVSQLVQRWLTTLRLLNKQLFAARNRQFDAMSAEAQADAALQEALGQRASLDQQLFALAQQIAQLDIGLNQVTVQSSLGTVAGPGEGTQTTVFQATLLASPLQIDKLNRDIARVAASLADLDTQRQAALGRFLSAERSASELLDAVTQMIMSTAYKKAAVDFIFNAIDVIKAAKNGGLIGATTETLKKVVETLVKEYAVDSGPGKYGSKGAEEFNQDLGTKLTNTYLGKIAAKTGVERVLKETVSNTGKDALNKYVGTLVFEKVYGTVPSLYEQAAGQLTALGNPSVEEIEQIQAAVDKKAAQFVALGGSYEGMPVKAAKGLGTKIGDLAFSLVKDLSKNYLKAHFDVQEQQAWTAYFEQEIVAETWFPLYAAIADKYWTVYKGYDDLLMQKAQLLDGYSSVGDAKTTLDKYFPADADLLVNLLGIISPTPSPLIKVLLGGIAPTAWTGTEYVVNAASLPISQQGAGIEVILR
jgi:hypothetical protein